MGESDLKYIPEPPRVRVLVEIRKLMETKGISEELREQILHKCRTQSDAEELLDILSKPQEVKSMGREPTREMIESQRAHLQSLLDAEAYKRLDGERTYVQHEYNPYDRR